MCIVCVVFVPGNVREVVFIKSMRKADGERGIESRNVN